jgi:hypothetical protein
MYSLIQCCKEMFADLNKSSVQPHETPTFRISVTYLNSVDPPVRGSLMVAQWLRYCATNRKVAGSIPDDVIGIFH